MVKRAWRIFSAGIRDMGYQCGLRVIALHLQFRFMRLYLAYTTWIRHLSGKLACSVKSQSSVSLWLSPTPERPRLKVLTLLS